MAKILVIVLMTAIASVAWAQKSRSGNSAFDAMDKNRDGALSKEEAAGDKELAKRFTRFDADKDGRLNVDEFIKANQDNDKRVLADSAITTKIKALLLAEKGRLRSIARAVVFIPVVIGLGASSLLWYWLFSYDYGLINRGLLDLGIISKPVVWFGADATLGTWAVISSIVWKVMGFGMILFIAAIQAIPQEVREAGRIDGASQWQAVRRIILPLTYRTVLLVTLVSIIGSLLAFDQFYIMTAGQPGNLTATSVFFIYLNSFPYLKLGYGAALSLILSVVVLLFTLLQLYLNKRLA